MGRPLTIFTFENRETCEAHSRSTRKTFKGEHHSRHSPQSRCLGSEIFAPVNWIPSKGSCDEGCSKLVQRICLELLLCAGTNETAACPRRRRVHLAPAANHRCKRPQPKRLAVWRWGAVGMDSCWQRSAARAHSRWTLARLGCADHLFKRGL